MGDKTPTEQGETTRLATEKAFAIPERIGHYRLRRVIGSGGMGTVYEAMQEQPRRTVALKVMKLGITSPAALRRFDHESQILGQLHHPGIAEVYEAGVHDDGSGGVPYFAMEYIPNARPLTEFARFHKLGTRERLDLFVNACDAVHHGHTRGVIHRDLKPDNILVDSSARPRIIDFGVARSTDSDLAATTLQTDVGQLIGTLQYMSPEQIDADPHDIDSRSDVYALGVILYELLCDRLPYHISKRAVHEAIRCIREEPPTPPSSVCKTVRGDLETIILRALSKDKQRRYGTAADLALDIRRYLAGEPIEARRDSAVYVVKTRAQKALLQHPIVAYLGIIAFAALFAEMIGVNLVYHWTSAHRAYSRFVVSIAGVAPESEAFESVVIIRLTDETVKQIDSIAADEGFDDVDPHAWKSVRRLHGRLMERLAPAGVGSVTFNIRFPGVTPYDGTLRAGVLALAERGVDVVVSNRDWSFEDEGRSEVSDVIARDVRWGGTTSGFDDDEPWYVHIVAGRPGARWLPSLALSSFAAFRHPGWDVDLEVKDVTLHVGYLQYPDPSDPRQQERLVPSDRIVASGVRTLPADGKNGLRKGDNVAYYLFDVPSTATLEASAVNLVWVLRAEPHELERRFSGKAVVVGDYRSNQREHRTPDGRVLKGTDGHAAALNAMLTDAGVRSEHAGLAQGTLPAAALLGLLIAVGTRRRPVVLVLLVLLAAAAMLVSSLVAYDTVHYLVNPMVPLLALVVACGLTIVVARVRLERVQ